MSGQNVFLVFCELSGSSPPLLNKGYAGAFVTCLVATEDIIDAIEQATTALDDDDYIVTDIDKAIRFDADEWKHDDEIIALAVEVTSDQLLRYSRLNTWGH